MARGDAFTKGNVPITLTGEEWFAILARFNEMISASEQGRAAAPLASFFSRKGKRVYDGAMQRWQNQLLAEQARLKSARPVAKPEGEADGAA